MTVEERMGRDGGSREQFPVGMRVLAVDDSPTCLLLLETLLVRCRYHVTTTNQAITALKMLRESRDRFDLVISDVHMPDMDGFKLLELVGLEMDLPVIMLSANGETKTVMKGITHGAVDYLLKPVRIEELKNIWQHVIRRKKVDRRDQNSSVNGEDCEKPQHGNSEGGQGAVSNGSSDHHGKLTRKRKDQTDEDEDDYEDNALENEDPSSQKKQRVVWSVELHRKFVAAVNQLGIEKAVPKRILDLMNGEKLTRENVASHLQKYRLYLKRLSAVASQQANMVAALGGRDMGYLPMYSMDGFGNIHTLAASGQPPALSSYQPNGVLNMTSPTKLAVQGLERSGMVHFGHTQNSTSHPINDLRKYQHISLPGNHRGDLLQGIPVSLELEKFQQQKRMPESTSHLTVGLSSSGLGTGTSSNSFMKVTDNPLLLQANRFEEIANHSSVVTPFISSNTFDISTGVSSCSPDLGRCNDTWQSMVPINCHTAKNSPMASPCTQDNLAQSISGTYATPLIPEAGNNTPNISFRSVMAAPLCDPLMGRHEHVQPSSLGREPMFMPTGIDEESRFLNFRTTGHPRQKCGEPKGNHISEPGFIVTSSVNLLPSQTITTENQRLHSDLSNQRIDTNMIGKTSFSAPPQVQSAIIDKSTSDGQLKYKDVCNLETPRFFSGFNSNGSNFDDLVNAMIKTEQDDVAFMDGDMGYDIFPLGTCM